MTPSTVSRRPDGQAFTSKRKRIAMPIKPVPPMGPLEHTYRALEQYFGITKVSSSSLPRGVHRAVYTIYQNLKVVKLHAIRHLQFTTHLKMRICQLKQQLEEFRHHQSMDKSTDLHSTDETATPEPNLKKIVPLLTLTDKVLSTLYSFMRNKPSLRNTIPSILWQHLEKLPQNLDLFPEHMARQLGESKSLLQRIVVLYNQLSEASRSLQATAPQPPLLTPSLPITPPFPGSKASPRVMPVLMRELPPTMIHCRTKRTMTQSDNHYGFQQQNENDEPDDDVSSFHVNEDESMYSDHVSVRQEAHGE